MKFQTICVCSLNRQRGKMCIRIGISNDQQIIESRCLENVRLIQRWLWLTATHSIPIKCTTVQIFVDCSRFERSNTGTSTEILSLIFSLSLSLPLSFPIEKRFAICRTSCGYHEIFTTWYFVSEQNQYLLVG